MIFFKRPIIIIKIIYYYLFIYLLYIKNINGINVKSSTAIKKDVNILGVDLSYALLDIEFDQDFYTYDSLACPNYTCPIISNNGIDCSCDYTDITDCPKTKGRDSSCPPCPLGFSESIPPDYKYGGVFCNSTQFINGVKYSPITTDWTVIELDKEYTFTTDKIMQFRFKADSGTSCMGMMLKISPIQGYPISSFGAVPSFDLSRFVSGSKVETNAVFNICPTDNWNKSEHYTYTKSWTRDTYFILVDPQNNGADNSLISFSLILRSKPVSPLINTTNQSKCISPFPQSHRCINLGENTFSESSNENQRDYYTFNVDKPSLYFFQFPSLFLTTSIFISNTYLNLFPSESNSQWFRKDSYENYFTLYLEPNSDGSDLIIYICVLSYLPTNYSFVVTRNGDIFPNQLSSMSLQQGAFSLASTSIFLPKFNDDGSGSSSGSNDEYYDDDDDGSNGNNFFTCNSQAECNPFSILYPTITINPLWPVPSVLYSVADFDFKSIIYNNGAALSGNIGLINTNFKSKSYQTAILLSYNNGKGNLKEYITYDEVLNSTIQFLSTLTDSNGGLIDIAVTGFKDVTKMICDYNEFKRVLQLIDNSSDSILNSPTSPTLVELNNWRYKLGLSMLNDAWIGCSSQAFEMLDIKLVKKNISSYYCPWKKGDLQFSTDPCCNTTFQYYQCCNPRFIETIVYQYDGIKDELVKDQCAGGSAGGGSLECIKSVLSEYGNYLTSDQCSDPSIQSNEVQGSIYSTLRDCKIPILNVPFCNQDLDCMDYPFGGPFGGKCDLYTRKCLVDYEILDKKYIECVFQQLSPATLNSFISSTTFNSSSILEKYNKHLQIDCVSQKGSSFPVRTTYKYTTDDAYVGITPAVGCLDKSCLTIYNSLFDIYYSGWSFIKEWNHLDDTCYDYGTCSQISCKNLNTDKSCKKQCSQLTSSEFCGYCSTSNSSCFNFNQTNTSDCQNSNPVCIISNGNYLTNLTQQECESDTIGICTHPCGFKCVNNGNGTSSSGNNCTNKSIDECGNDDSCRLVEIACKNKSECENYGGECSDLFYFKPENVKYYPFGLGKCVVNHTFLQRENSKILSCQNGQTDSPMGCFPQDPIYTSKKECELKEGRKWWTMSIGKEQCLSINNFACSIMDIDSFANLPFNFKFNEMNQQECESCDMIHSTKWINRFNWTQGKWLPGIYIKPQWYNNTTRPSPSPFNSRELKAIFNYQSFYNDLIDAVGKQTADFYRSQTFCKKERNQNSLNSISCSCSGSHSAISDQNQSVCFESSTPLLGLTKQCDGGENSTLQFTNGKLNLTGNSVLPGCQMITISLVSKLIFTSTVPSSLASNFVSYSKPDNYGVLNLNGAIVGTLLMDGIMIKSEQTILEMTICWDYSQISSNSKYPDFDLATNFNSTSDFPHLYPMQVNTYILETTTGSAGSRFICSDLLDVESETVLFLINIKSGNWKDLEKELFDSTTKSLLYILGVLFLLVSCFGYYQIIQIILSIKSKAKGEREFLITHWLTCLVTSFITLRFIYFFLMPGGYFSSNPFVDYVLVVLPTFIYFTSFIIMIVIWYIIVFLVLKYNSSAAQQTQRLKLIVFIVNVILYILFIIVVLVFQYTNDIPINNCGARIVVEPKNSKPQIIVSILYAVIQVLLSLAIGASFAYLASSLYRTLKKANFTSLKSDHQRKAIKIFTITVVCSIGFLFHCIFILVLVSSDLNSIAFSFIGLLLTEIFPAAMILYCFKTTTSNSNLSLCFFNKKSKINSAGSSSNTSFESSKFQKSKKLKKTNTTSPKILSLNNSIDNNNNNNNNTSTTTTTTQITNGDESPSIPVSSSTSNSNSTSNSATTSTNNLISCDVKQEVNNIL